MNPLKLPLLLTPLTYIHVGNPNLLPPGEKELHSLTFAFPQLNPPYLAGRRHW